MTRRQAAVQAAIITAIGFIVIVAVVKTLNWIFDEDPVLWFILFTLPVITGVIAYSVDALTEKKPTDG